MQRFVITCDLCGREARDEEVHNHEFIVVNARRGERTAAVHSNLLAAQVGANLDACPACFGERFAAVFGANKNPTRIYPV